MFVPYRFANYDGTVLSGYAYLQAIGHQIPHYHQTYQKFAPLNWHWLLLQLITCGFQKGTPIGVPC